MVWKRDCMAGKKKKKKERIVEKCCVCSQLKYKELYERSKAQITIDHEARSIRAAKEAYTNITNVSGPGMSDLRYILSG